MYLQQTTDQSGSMVMVVSSPLLPRAGVRQLEVGHDEVFVVLDILRLHVVDTAL